MSIDEQEKAIESATNKLLKKMGFPATVYVGNAVSSSDTNKDPVAVEIRLEDSKFLIGKRGVNLAALQHILRVIVSKNANEKVYFNVDVNGYKAQHEQSLVNLAQRMASKATQEGKVVVLEPMNSFERRIIHVELDNLQGVKTESIGEGEDRKVVIKPASLSEELAL